MVSSYADMFLNSVGAADDVRKENIELLSQSKASASSILRWWTNYCSELSGKRNLTQCALRQPVEGRIQKRFALLLRLLNLCK